MDPTRLAAAGCAAGATTLAVYGSVASPFLSLDVSGIGAATYLILLGAKRIADGFRVDKPELAAHLVASKVIGSVPAMAIEQRIGSTD